MCCNLNVQFQGQRVKAFSLTHRPPLTPGNIPITHICYRLNRPQCYSAAGRIMSKKNSNDTNGNQTRELPVCSAVPQPPRARKIRCDRMNNKRNNLYHNYKFLTKLGCFLFPGNQYNLSGS